VLGLTQSCPCRALCFYVGLFGVEMVFVPPRPLVAIPPFCFLVSGGVGTVGFLLVGFIVRRCNVACGLRWLIRPLLSPVVPLVSLLILEQAMPSVDSPAEGGELLTFVRVVWVDVALLTTEDVAKCWVEPEM
jgi:hypothetical protein